jgi:glycosyltransferase involved in cell wall biosynthesis
MKKLRILFYATLFDGTGYYRIAEPVRMIKKLGLAEVTMNPWAAYKQPKETWTNLEQGADGIPKAVHHLAKVLGDPKKPNFDAIVFQRIDTVHFMSLALGLRSTYNIPILQENDDYVFDVPQTNPGSLDYRERKQEYQNNVNDPFTVARRSLGIFDGYITTTPFLKKYFDNYSPAFICPNSIPVSERVIKPRKPHQDIRIMFSSSAGHLENLEFIKEPVTRILEKYPNVTFYYYKFMPNLWKDTKLEKRVKTMTWKKPDEYWAYINELAPDICLAPLTDRLYNRGKSNLRLLEYWSSKNAVICSPVGHYKETVRHGDNALFAKTKDEWFEQMELLIENPNLRHRIAEGGYKTLTKDFNLEKNARLWVDACRSVVANYNPNKQAPDKYLQPDQREQSR